MTQRHDTSILRIMTGERTVPAIPPALVNTPKMNKMVVNLPIQTANPLHMHESARVNIADEHL